MKKGGIHATLNLGGRGKMRTKTTFTLAMCILALTFPALAKNGANDYLLSLAPSARAQMLGKVVGGRCAGKDTFYMGIGTSGFSMNKAFWSVRCQDGRAYVVEANPDGTSKVLECATLKALHAGGCFKKLSGAR